jgi:hypothetical protein
VRQASLDDLSRAPGMNRKAATQVAAYFAERARLEGEAGGELDGGELGPDPSTEDELGDDGEIVADLSGGDDVVDDDEALDDAAANGARR